MPWEVDNDKCSGCGLCVDTAAEVFAMDDNDEFAIVTKADTGADDDAAKEAEEGCPEEAITFAE